MKMDPLNMVKKAKREGYAIGAFNTSDLEITQAICEAAAEMEAPVIVQTTPSTIEYAGLEQIYHIVTDEIAEQGICSYIHLDHGKDVNLIKKAVDVGYKSVMIDASKYPYDTNVALTKKIVSYGHKHGAIVEGEIGVLGTEEGGDESGSANFTDPSLAVKFAEKTGVDTLAVSVGNEHGAPLGESIDHNLLAEIAKKVATPLVMHGSSGLSKQDIREAIGIGVVKFNIDTNLRQAFMHELRHVEGLDDPRDALSQIKDAIKEVVFEYIKLFGSEGKCK